MPVDSGTIRSIGYDADRAVLQVEFRDTSLYDYFFVPALVYSELMEAESKGHYVNERIVGHFPYEKTDP